MCSFDKMLPYILTNITIRILVSAVTKVVKKFHAGTEHKFIPLKSQCQPYIA